MSSEVVSSAAAGGELIAAAVALPVAVAFGAGWMAWQAENRWESRPGTWSCRWGTWPSRRETFWQRPMMLWTWKSRRNSAGVRSWSASGGSPPRPAGAI